MSDRSRSRPKEPYLLNKRLIKKLVAASRNGAFHTELAALAGVRRETIYDWLRRGQREWIAVTKMKREPDPKNALHMELAIKVERALIAWEREQRDVISKAATGYVRTKKKRTQKVSASGAVESTTVEEEIDEMDWRAALVLLERRFPERYIRRLPEEQTREGTDDPELRIVLDDGLTPPPAGDSDDTGGEG